MFTVIVEVALASAVCVVGTRPKFMVVVDSCTFAGTTAETDRLFLAVRA